MRRRGRLGLRLLGEGMPAGRFSSLWVAKAGIDF